MGKYLSEHIRIIYVLGWKGVFCGLKLDGKEWV